MHDARARQKAQERRWPSSEPSEDKVRSPMDMALMGDNDFYLDAYRLPTGH